MKIRNMGQKYVTSQVRDMARPVPPAAQPCQPSKPVLLLLLHGQATY